MKLVDIKGNITSKQRLILVITALILLLIVFYLLKNITKTSEGIDYKKTDITDLLIFSSTVKDRDIYWNLDGIVTEFISSYKSVTNKDIKETKYYYNALDPDYKKYLGKKKYNEIANNLINKVMGENRDEFSSLPTPLITSLNKLNNYDNAYICELSTSNVNDSAYIGIILDTDKKKYNIFYID